ncbi:MAG TPA: CehA/McbA family metallohydrolase, partial [Bacteroidota bacterium]
RIEPRQPLPVLILCKDAHHYPCILHSLSVTVRANNHVVLEKQLLDSPVVLTESYWWQVFHLEPNMGSGSLLVDVTFDLEVDGKRKLYHNDNHRTSTHKPLRVYRSKDPLPGYKGLVWGDCHTHSNFTEDQVEFGSPLEASALLCKSMGLSFFCVTDHSYDLDDRLDNYLVNDPTLPKWKLLRQTIDGLNNRENAFVTIRGEEISCRNFHGNNVHMILLGNRSFFPGSGDSAERWFQTRSEMSVQEILLAKEEHAVAVAAHPFEKVPLLQRLLLGRGAWAEEDLEHSALTGIQFANGGRDSGFESGYRHWIRCLLDGKRLLAVGGNDAHGNFNRFRQVGIPFIMIRESNQQLFGKLRTGVFLDSPLSEQTLLNNIRLGRTIVSDGPALNLIIEGENHATSIGSEHVGGSFQFEIEAKSTVDYGAIDHVKVLKGIIGGNAGEQLILERTALKLYEWREPFSVKIEQPCYLRAEIFTEGHQAYDQQPHFAMTNPLWLKPL